MRNNQHAVTLTVDGVPTGVWDTKAGGEVDSEETKHRRGGMGPVRSLGGSTTVGNVTLTRLLDQDTNDPDTMRWLMSRAGKGEAVASDQFLDREGNAFGRPFVYTGTIKTVTPPDHDANDDGASMWTVVISTEGEIA